MPADTSSRMRMYYHKAVWQNVDIGKFITEEIDREILENLTKLVEADENAENDSV